MRNVHEAGPPLLGMTVRQVTEATTCSKTLIYHLIKLKKLRAVKVRGRTIIPVAEVTRLLEEGA